MKKLIPYLIFNGCCEEAIQFYAYALDGEILAMQRFGDGPQPVAEEAKNNVMHTILKADEFTLMASDTMPENKVENGANISLSIDFSSEEDLQRVYDRLAEGATIVMPLQDTFWGARFGILTDRFGIPWMFNFDKELPGQ